ncbi:16S rRNA (guanine(527)-N(7))-methyltransferase RsmG [Boudabousia marimammalium]|uniref:Ribosomal RNA small subunit methyltransferase G n=1 Tax=Boudabousia marimammalium TaxID=156892 RepID=A0A1Q5PTH3_9ACTO|nr:16S rRNA (guanine(527)-N(7))-methyltransferase RsmG [Boudabousia marimammalium]OKL50680.1 16S rRNA (guanine(527)-N(7))-methyltransferase RsmG [Boudabousia marimammalium]
MAELFDLHFGQIEHFAGMLADEGELRGLIGPRELPRLWSRHLVNSAAVVPFLPSTGTVADVGSGAGFPGIVVACLCPDLEIHLIEPMERRVSWLSEVSEELGLDNVVIHHRRAEELHQREAFDAVTARAVAAMDKLARFTAPLIRRGGTLVALKGANVDAELEKSKYVLKRLHLVEVEVNEVSLPDSESTMVVTARKA